MICAQITSLAKQTWLQKLEEHIESVLGPPSSLPLILQTQEEVTASRADENQPSLPKQLVRVGEGSKGAKKKEDIKEKEEEEESIEFKKRKGRGRSTVIMERRKRKNSKKSI